MEQSVRKCCTRLGFICCAVGVHCVRSKLRGPAVGFEVLMKLLCSTILKVAANQNIENIKYIMIKIKSLK